MPWAVHSQPQTIVIELIEGTLIRAEFEFPHKTVKGYSTFLPATLYAVLYTGLAGSERGVQMIRQKSTFRFVDISR